MALGILKKFPLYRLYPIFHLPKGDCRFPQNCGIFLWVPIVRAMSCGHFRGLRGSHLSGNAQVRYSRGPFGGPSACVMHEAYPRT